MGRPNRITEDNARDIIKLYLMRNSPRTINPTALARFCRDELQMDDITYQHFSRNKTAMGIIHDTNDRLLSIYSVNKTDTDIFSTNNSYFAEDIILAYQNAENPNQYLREFIEKINKEKNNLVNCYLELLSKYESMKKAYNEFERLSKETSDILQAVKIRLKTTEDNLKDQENKTKHLQKTIRKLNAYMKQYIYDPLLFQHFQEIGLVDLNKKITPNVTTAFAQLQKNENYYEILSQFYEIIDSYSEKSNEVKPRIELPNMEKKQKMSDQVVTSKDNSLWIDKFENL